MSIINQSKSIVWLHLSDLHLCKPKTGWDAHRVMKPLIRDLKRMENDHGLLPQLMFFTGDAAFGNYGSGPGSTLAEQYRDVETFLTGVRAAFSAEIPKQNLFLVPGNHDVDRAEVTELEIEWIENKANTESVTQLIKEKKKAWKQYMDRLKVYRQFLENNAYTHLLDDPERLIYSQIREFHGIKLGIGGFNSAWNCSREKEKGKLWLGGDWQNGTIVESLDIENADLKLALIHHPPGWFVEQEDVLIRSQMARDFDFFLHGHEHQGWVNAINNRHVRIAAAASYEKSDQENGYNFVRLNLETGDMEIWLRKFDGHGGWIPRVIEDMENNNGLWLIKNFQPILSLISTKLPNDNPSLVSTKGLTSPTALTVSEQVRAEVREEIRKIIPNPDMDRIGKILHAKFKKHTEKDKTQTELEIYLVPYEIEPFPIISIIDEWHTIVKNWLEVVQYEPPKLLEHAIRVSKDIMEWLLRLAVPDAWVLSQPDNSLNSSIKPTKGIPENHTIWAEIGNGRLSATRPSLEFVEEDYEVRANRQICHTELDYPDLESGMFSEDYLQKVLQIIWKKVTRNDKFPTTKEMLANLPKMLERRFKDGERYNITIPYEDYSAMSKNPIWNELGKIFEHFGIFVYGTGFGDRVLIVPESDLLVSIKEFLYLLSKYQSK